MHFQLSFPLLPSLPPPLQSTEEQQERERGPRRSWRGVETVTLLFQVSPLLRPPGDMAFHRPSAGGGSSLGKPSLARLLKKREGKTAPNEKRAKTGLAPFFSSFLFLVLFLSSSRYFPPSAPSTVRLRVLCHYSLPATRLGSREMPFCLGRLVRLTLAFSRLLQTTGPRRRSSPPTTRWATSLPLPSASLTAA